MTSTTAASAGRDPANVPFYVANGILSAAALSLLGWLLLVHRAQGASEQLSYLPAVNATLNATTALLLLLGRVAIKRKHMQAHRSLMVSAFVASSLFLVSYLTYHYLHGDTRFVGPSAVRVVYLVILVTHVLLSMTVVPLALSAFFFAFRRNFATHVKVTRVLWPIWMYVAVTGVVIYAFLRASY
jgi:putative membrane protein